MRMCTVATTPPFDAHAHRCNESGCCCFNGLCCIFLPTRHTHAQDASRARNKRLVTDHEHAGSMTMAAACSEC